MALEPAGAPGGAAAAVGGRPGRGPGGFSRPHDALRLRFTSGRQTYGPAAGSWPLTVWICARADRRPWRRRGARPRRAWIWRRVAGAGGALPAAWRGWRPAAAGGDHLIVDGVSCGCCCGGPGRRSTQALSSERRPALPPKTWSVQRWAACLASYAGSPAAEAEVEYWTGGGRDEVAAMAGGLAAGRNTEGSAGRCGVAVSRRDAGAAARSARGVPQRRSRPAAGGSGARPSRRGRAAAAAGGSGGSRVARGRSVWRERT